jgi:hypothetical protein
LQGYITQYIRRNPFKFIGEGKYRARSDSSSGYSVWGVLDDPSRKKKKESIYEGRINAEKKKEDYEGRVNAVEKAKGT